MLNRQMRFGAAALLNLALVIVSGAAGVWLAMAGHGVWSLVWAGMIGSVLHALALGVVAGWVPRVTVRPVALRRLAGYGFKVSANDFVTYLQNQVPAFLLSRAATLHDVGIYNKGSSLSGSAGWLVVGAIYGPLFRGLAATQDNRDQALYLFGRALTTVAFYALPLFIGTAWLAEPMVVLLYGERWVESVPIVRLLASLGLLGILMTVSGAVIQAHNAVGREIVIQIQGLVLFAATALVATRWGTLGVAAALAVFWLFMAWRLTRLALACVNGSARFVAAALKEPLLLNLLLVVVLAGGEAFRRIYFADASMLAYAVAMTLLGGAAYGLSFLYLPLGSLASEVTRWKRALRFTN